ncbi:SpoVT / AbrB-like protein [Candidatus Nitrososphaera evergladensis SR1]|uniref:SpoVT / AbrB-like protein n=2 Tax=Nitrososphaera TaxID=497726 RepID=A0A075MRQ2_9ARCH|nr:SpoVT / AbrB-like protein [Candidatus Nitrososphaera evergladensis SR1]
MHLDHHDSNIYIGNRGYIRQSDMITSKVQTANQVSGSIRVTIPYEIAKALKLEVGDVLAWDLDGKKATVRKLE